MIAFYDAKYTYRLWRPVTAIRAADTTATPTRPATRLDAALEHRARPVLSGRARHDQRRRAPTCSPRVYGNDVAFTVDVAGAARASTRSFVSFSEAAEEASVSRIYNGNHTRIDEVAGENLGHDVAGYVLRHRFLTPDRGS